MKALGGVPEGVKRVKPWKLKSLLVEVKQKETHLEMRTSKTRQILTSVNKKPMTDTAFLSCQRSESSILVLWITAKMSRKSRWWFVYCLWLVFCPTHSSQLLLCNSADQRVLLTVFTLLLVLWFVSSVSDVKWVVCRCSVHFQVCTSQSRGHSSLSICLTSVPYCRRIYSEKV